MRDDRRILSTLLDENPPVLAGGKRIPVSNGPISLMNHDEQQAGMADAMTSPEKNEEHLERKGETTMMGGWLIWLLLGGLFLFLMFRGGGCCGGHGGHDDHYGGSPGRKNDG